MTVETRRLRNLIAAVERGELGDNIAEPAAERGREIVIDSWSGVQPPRSAPGEPPAIDTGALSRSMTVFRIRGGYGVGANTDYARALEFGNPGRGLAARPYLRPMALVLWNEINKKNIARNEIQTFIARNAR